ncbi:unnamed protein product [Camellia sinensis]
MTLPKHDSILSLSLSLSLIFKIRRSDYSAAIFLQSRDQEMAINGAAPPRGSAAAAAANLRRRRTTSGGGAAGGASSTMLQFYTDDAPGLKISPNVVLIMSIGFIAFVAVLHVMGKLYFVRQEAWGLPKIGQPTRSSNESQENTLELK